MTLGILVIIFLVTLILTCVALTANTITNILESRKNKTYLHSLELLQNELANWKKLKERSDEHIVILDKRCYTYMCQVNELTNVNSRLKAIIEDIES